MKTIFKALVFLVIMLVFMPMSLSAQKSDVFFRNIDNDLYDNRDDVADWEFTNETFGEVPLGSGLLVLAAVGAGYAVSRRRRMRGDVARRVSTLLLACLMLLGMTQCKKKIAEPTTSAGGEKVYITLHVGDGSKYDVNTTNGKVNYQVGDKIYVGNNGRYIGTLTCSNVNDKLVFGGEITSPSTDDYLHFYFVGGLDAENITPSAAELTVGETTSFTVDISDQSSKLPVVSYVHTAEYYNGGTSYVCKLRNQCALVRFPLNNPISSIAIGVGGMHTEATIDFATPGITPTETTGIVRLYSASATEKWAVLLLQDAVDNASVYVVESIENCKVDVPEITANGYVTDIPEVELNVLDLAHITSANRTASNGWVIIGETNVTTTAATIAAGATVALDNVTINGSTSNSRPGIRCNGDATIILNGTNSVNACGDKYSGIFIQEGFTLTIEGHGSLDVRSNGAAGIGGCRQPTNDGGNIVINSGTINATGGGDGAGIGCCYNRSCGNIVINGGTIIATGSGNGAGIGGSTYSTCGDITINGGTITATGAGEAAGIGSAYISSYCGAVTITTGVTSVTATKGSGNLCLCSIGKGSRVNEGHAESTQSHCGTVTIGGTIYWDGSDYQNGGAAYLQQATITYEP